MSVLLGNSVVSLVDIFWVVFLACGLVILLVVGLIAAAVMLYKAGDVDERSIDAPQSKGNSGQIRQSAGPRRTRRVVLRGEK
jgi:hypothetical protein